MGDNVLCGYDERGFLVGVVVRGHDGLPVCIPLDARGPWNVEYLHTNDPQVAREYLWAAGAKKVKQVKLRMSPKQ